MFWTKNSRALVIVFTHFIIFYFQIVENFAKIPYKLCTWQTTPSEDKYLLLKALDRSILQARPNCWFYN